MIFINYISTNLTEFRNISIAPKACPGRIMSSTTGLSVLTYDVLTVQQKCQYHCKNTIEYSKFGCAGNFREMINNCIDLDCFERNKFRRRRRINSAKRAHRQHNAQNKLRKSEQI